MESNTHKVLKGISSQTLVTIVLGVVEIVSFSIMSRLLSQMDFGYYAAVVAIGAVFQSISDAGIGSAVIQQKDLTNAYVNNAFTLSVLFGISVAALMCVTAAPLARLVADDTMIVPLRIFSVTLVCHCISSINLSLLQRNLKFFTIGIINLISLVVTTCVAIFLALKGLGYYAILAKVVLASIFNVILSWIATRARYRLSFDKATYRQIFGFGGWLMASAIFRNLAHQTDRLMMKSLFSIEVLGFYTRPHEFIQNITGKVNSIFDSVFFPVLSTIQDSKESLRRSFSYVFHYLNMGGLLLSFAFLFCHELIIRIFFGFQWCNVSTLFVVMSPWCVILVNGRMGDVFLRSLAMTKIQFLLRVAQLITVTMCILIGYRWGIVSMAISSMVGYTIIVIIKTIIIARRIEVPLKKAFVDIFQSYKIILWMLPLYAICHILIPNTTTGSILYACIFVSACAVLFLFIPFLVGKRYKTEVYPKIISFIRSRVGKLPNNNLDS